jgi:F-type H+-transporting ATP synthase subunit e
MRSIFPERRTSMCLLLNSDTSQVLRYSALVVGIFYGFSHQRTITNTAHAAHVQSEYKKKESLIQKAKLEWAKKTLPPSAKTAEGDIISDPEDKNFDLEAFLTKVAAEN